MRGRLSLNNFGELRIPQDVGMKYSDLVESIRNFENFFWFGEYVYFKTLEELEDIRADLGILDSEKHMKQIIKAFLIQWGGMRRTVDRKDLNWEQITTQLRGSKGVFQKLQNKSLLDINLEDEETADAIKKAYNSAKVKYIGATAISKILHIFNPELFVMWDEEIRKKYEVTGSISGYLKFLRLVKRDVEEAIEEEATKIGCSKKEIVKKICTELPSNRLCSKHKRKTLTKLIDEYNWWIVHHASKH